MSGSTKRNADAGLTHRLSPWRIVFMLIGCATIAFVGGYMTTRPDWFVAIVGGLMAAGFTAIAVSLISRWATFGSETVLAIAPEGLLDLRLAPQIIPWSAIRDVDVWRSASSRGIVLTVDEAVLGMLELTRAARLSQVVTSGLGPNQLPVSALELNTDFKTLFIEITDAWKLHR
ncbi:MAG: STM3941 family protein [Pseudomonadota bacterium]